MYCIKSLVFIKNPEHIRYKLSSFTLVSCALRRLFKMLGSVRFLLFSIVFKEVSSAHQGCIYYIENTVKNCNKNWSF